MRIALGIIAIVLFVFVASRYGVQKKQAELCELEAMRTYPDRSTARPGMGLDHLVRVARQRRPLREGPHGGPLVPKKQTCFHVCRMSGRCQEQTRRGSIAMNDNCRRTHV